MPSIDTDVAWQAAAAPAASQALFAPPGPKLVLLGATTWGAYIWYWLYRNWHAIRSIEARPEIMPVWRAGLAPLWVCSCLRRLGGDLRTHADDRFTRRMGGDPAVLGAGAERVRRPAAGRAVAAAGSAAAAGEYVDAPLQA
ncbi:MAG TPA: hypothetical protein DDZ67_03490 [Xanthomonadaceae bacterium]|nr:hypothetical protein [Xanthomonadaceae bacterium]